MSDKFQKYLVNSNKNKVFTNKTFNDFRNDLLKYANEFYSNNIIDFSETSLGGMFLDFAAIVGDSLVYYAEQQFNEIDFETATDPENLTRFLRRYNIRNSKASPSSVTLTMQIIVPSTDENIISDPSLLPIVHKNSEFESNNGTGFVLLHDVDFSKNYKVIRIIDNGNDTYNFVISKEGICSSGKILKEYFNFSSENSGKFLSLELENEEITEIISVYDNDNNEYFEVEYLTQDFVFKKVKDASADFDNLSITAAPHRYIVEENYDTGKTSLRFGNGDNNMFSNNILPNTEDLLLPLKHKDYVGRIDISPENILSSNLLGISPQGKNVTVTYKYGGGTLHNVSRNSINNISNINISFPNTTNTSVIDSIKNTIQINNDEKAVGGNEIPDFEKLKVALRNSVKMQSRIVTHEDLLTRLLVMPSNFGKIHKVAALDNENFFGVKDIFIVCKDENDFIVNSNDALKKNISKYINENRIIGNNFNIIDSPIFNFEINLKVKINKGFDLELVRSQLTYDILSFMRFDNFEIGQGINVNKLVKIVESNKGVMTIITEKNKIVQSKYSNSNIFDFESGQLFEYSNNRFNPVTSYKEGIVMPPRGGIFEIKYPIDNIKILVSN